MYERFCAANCGAVEKPCPNEPWHQVQLLSAKFLPVLTSSTSPNDEATVEKTDAKIAIFSCMRFMNFLCGYRETTKYQTERSYFR